MKGVFHFKNWYNFVRFCQNYGNCKKSRAYSRNSYWLKRVSVKGQTTTKQKMESLMKYCLIRLSNQLQHCDKTIRFSCTFEETFGRREWSKLRLINNDIAKVLNISLLQVQWQKGRTKENLRETCGNEILQKSSWKEEEGKNANCLLLIVLCMNSSMFLPQLQDSFHEWKQCAWHCILRPKNLVQSPPINRISPP